MRPTDSLYIGTFESLRGQKLPAYLSLSASPNVCYLTEEKDIDETNKILQAIILNTLRTLPPRSCRLILYDGVGLGRNLISLANLNDKIIGSGICTRPSNFRDILDSVISRIEYVIQRVLGTEFNGKTIIEYNEKYPDKAEPLTLLVISDFPKSLFAEHIEMISRIMNSGKSAGVYVLMSFVADSTDYLKLFRDIMGMSTVIYRSDGRFYIKNIENESVVRQFVLQHDLSVLNEANNVVKSINDSYLPPQKSLRYADNIPPKSEWWTGDSSQQIDLPFGVTEPQQREPAELSITQVNEQNTTIVLGGSGTGKSVFLHLLIMSAALKYSPDELELYLIDFSGVEFDAYALHRLPHARVIAPESEREFGLSVLQEIQKEGARRMELFRNAHVSSINEYRARNNGDKLPRILVIIDEFHKLFDNELDKLSEESERIMKIIVKEYRKFGINLILATQSIHAYANKIALGLIGNRVMFSLQPEDETYLLSGNLKNDISMLAESGVCMYSSNGKYSFAKTYTYNIGDGEREHLLSELSSFATGQKHTPQAQTVFRGNATVHFCDNKDISSLQRAEIPDVTRVYIGESFTISASHIHIDLDNTPNSNILIIGGQGADAGLRTAINCVKSLEKAHTDRSAYFAFFNFIQRGHSLYESPKTLYQGIDQDVVFVEPQDQLDYLRKLQGEIMRRSHDTLVKRRHVYLSIYGLQNSIEFRKTGEWGDMTEAANLLTEILDLGPLVGVFTILHVDDLGSLKKSINNPLDFFNHRVVLQMNRDDSSVIMDSPLASKLYEDGKDYTRNRAYYFNRNTNTIIKFKPYEI